MSVDLSVMLSRGFAVLLVWFAHLPLNYIGACKGQKARNKGDS